MTGARKSFFSLWGRGGEKMDLKDPRKRVPVLTRASTSLRTDHFIFPTFFLHPHTSRISQKQKENFAGPPGPRTRIASFNAFFPYQMLKILKKTSLFFYRFHQHVLQYSSSRVCIQTSGNSIDSER